MAEGWRAWQKIVMRRALATLACYLGLATASGAATTLDASYELRLAGIGLGSAQVTGEVGPELVSCRPGAGLDGDLLERDGGRSCRGPARR